MLIKPEKPPSQTTSYRPISLLSAIMKLFEWVMEKRLRKHLEDNFFFSKYQSGIKFLGITFDNRMTFTKHFEEILERCNEKFHRLRILVNKKWGPSPETILQIYKQFVRPIFEYEIVSTITVSETVITKIQRVQNSFIRLALHLPKYVLAHLLHEALGFPYVRERLITVGQNHLNRMHANPLVEHTVNSTRTNIAWDKYKTPISILKPPD